MHAVPFNISPNISKLYGIRKPIFSLTYLFNRRFLAGKPMAARRSQVVIETTWNGRRESGSLLEEAVALNRGKNPGYLFTLVGHVTWSKHYLVRFN